MRLLLADDHILFRDALVQFIQRAEPEAIVMLAKDLHEVVDIMEGDPDIDLILLDFRMPGMDGFRGVERLRQDYSSTKVALLSGLAEKHDVEKAMELGASGFFSKTMSGKAMLCGVHKILQGEQYVATDHNTNDVMPSYYNGNNTRSHNKGGGDQQGGYEGGGLNKLTPREKEVLSYLLQGASNKEIARGLGLQVVTIKLHVRGICRKLGAKNRTQAALRAQQMGLDSEG